MSDELGNYQFSSWARAGSSASLAAGDPLDGSLSPRAALDVKLVLNGNTSVPVSLEMLGPGDVKGCDPSVFGTMTPAPSSSTFEPGYLAAIELLRPELPWLLTPAAANAQGRLRPWIALVVVEQRAGELPTFDAALGVHSFTISGADLPDLAESWAWAHVQTSAGKTIARLLSPRHLRPDHHYVACVVPTFEAGRLAGLGRLDDADKLTALAPAWAPGQASVQLPVYHFWQFATTSTGDFASLVHALKPALLRSSVGMRAMDLVDAGFQLEQDSPISVPGVLQAPAAHAVEWPAYEETSFAEGMRAVLTAPAQTPVVLPPTYGKWHAAAPPLVDGAHAPRWLEELNLDPRMRVFAGAGARAIEQQQETWLAQAWAQLGDAQEANRLLHLAQLARGAQRTIAERRLKRMGDDQLVPITAPLHFRTTVVESLTNQPAFDGPAATGSRTRTLGDSMRRAKSGDAVRAGFRRFMRPRGPVVRRARVAGPRTILPYVTTLEGAGNPGRLGFIATAGVTLNDTIANGGRSWPAGEDNVWPVAANVNDIWPTEEDWPLPDGTDSLVAVAAVSDHLNATQPKPIYTVANPSWAPPPTADRSSALRAALAVDPVIARAVAARVANAPASTSKDPLEPVLGGPSFDTPMFTALRDQSRDFILPGLGDVPPDTLGILQVNPAPIAAFMVGLNHAMNRTLLWRGYPTDQRGTAFQRFWSAQRDIEPITSWSASSDLATNVVERPGGALVLLVRGKLIERYPDAIIYALPAVWTAAGKRALGTARRDPLFRGSLDPDVTFVGFDLSVAAARGSSKVSDNRPGYFFIIEQHPTAPEFGLASESTPKPPAWDAVSWTNLKGGDSVASIPVAATAIDTSAMQAVPDVAWGKDAASMAYITLRRPARVAVHADTLLPKDLA